MCCCTHEHTQFASPSLQETSCDGGCERTGWRICSLALHRVVRSYDAIEPFSRWAVVSLRSLIPATSDFQSFAQMSMTIPLRATRWRMTLIAIGLAFGSVQGAAAKASFWDLFEPDPHGTIAETERRALLDFYASTGGDSTWDRHDGWNGPPGSECRWYGITCNHEHVIAIDLAGNNLQGPLPDISALSELKRLGLGHNRLTGSMASIAKLSSLRTLSVGDNAFSGTLPPLSGLHSLEYFRAGSNRWSGDIPALRGLSNLETFVIDDSGLSGSIPSLEGLTQLETIDLNDNHLSGPIPALTGLASLATIDFSRNQLSGSIPALEGLSKLHAVKLDHNQLQGVMPEAPVPNELVRGGSSLCPNRLASTGAVQWDRATGTEPWYKTCVADGGADTPVKIASPSGDSSSRSN